MKNLWQEIGFVPTSFELEESDKTEDDLEQAEKDAPKVSQEKFPPRLQRQEPSIRDMEHSNGITIRNLPGILDDKEILTFLMNYGLPHDHDIQHIHINKGGKNTWVMIDFLEPKDVQTIFHCVDFHATKTKFFDVPIFCKPLRNMTPVKKSKDESEAANDILTKRSEITDKKKVEEMNTASNDTNKPAVENPKPKIPGLPEEDRLKKKKKKKKQPKQKKEHADDVPDNLSVEYFLVSPNSGIVKENEKEENDFVFSDSPLFSDREDSDSESEADSDEFEDSRDVRSDTERVSEDLLLFTPARTLQAESSSSKPSSTPKSKQAVKTDKPTKRSAKSPLDSNETKKSRGQSKPDLPKKK